MEMEGDSRRLGGLGSSPAAGATHDDDEGAALSTLETRKRLMAKPESQPGAQYRWGTGEEGGQVRGTVVTGFGLAFVQARERTNRHQTAQKKSQEEEEEEEEN